MERYYYSQETMKMDVTIKSISEKEIRRYIKHYLEVDVDVYLKMVEVVNKCYMGKFTHLLYSLMTNNSRGYTLYRSMPFSIEDELTLKKCKLIENIQSLVASDCVETEIVLYKFPEIDSMYDVGAMSEVGTWFNEVYDVEEHGKEDRELLLDIYFQLLGILNSFENATIHEWMNSEDIEETYVFVVTNKFDCLELALC